MKMSMSCLFFVLCCLGTMEANTEINPRWRLKTWTLHTLSGYTGYPYYKWPEVYVDATNRPIVLFYFVFRDGDSFKEQIILFVLDKGAWVESKGLLPDNSFCSGMIKDGAFCAYSVNFPQSDVRRAIISVYGLDSNAKLIAEPIRTFDIETDKAYTTKLMSVKGDPDRFFVVGQRQESRLLNPITFIAFLTTAGHAGFVWKPFGAIVEQKKITNYYNTPEKLETDEASRIEDTVQSGSNILCISTKDMPYGSEATSIQYLSFDLTKRCWIEPVQLFQGHKKSGIFETISSPTLTSDGKNIYCTWSWNVQVMINNEYVPKEETGIYFCDKIADHWNKPVKLADSGYNPQVFIDNKQVVHVVWSDDKGLCHKDMTATGWTETELIIKDKRISIRESPSVAVDKDGNLYITYVREKQLSLPAELVCLKLFSSP